jgi:hypothetical protein
MRSKTRTAPVAQRQQRVEPQLAGLRRHRHDHVGPGDHCADAVHGLSR